MPSLKWRQRPSARSLLNQPQEWRHGPFLTFPTFPMLTIYDYLTIGFYFAFLLCAGFVVRHLNKGSTDYFAGGRRMTWWLLGASSLVSNFSAWSFTGAASIAYQFGILFFAVFMVDIAGFIISLLWFAPRFRRLRLVTAMDAVRLRFGKANEQLITWLQIFTSFFGGAVWMVGLSVIIAAVTPLNQVSVILLSGTVIVIIATVGGRWGVTATDFVQLALLALCVVATAFLTLHHVGGVSNFVRQLPDTHFDFFRPLGSITYDWLWVVAALFYGMYQKNSLVFGAAKYIMAMDDKGARKSVWIPLIGYAILPIFWFIPAAGAFIIVPDLMQSYGEFNNPAEASFIAVCVKLLPSGMLGLMLAALFAATMSSMDTALNVNAGFLVKNVYQPLFRQEASEMELQRVGQVATVVCGVIIVGLAILIVKGGSFSLFDAYLYLNAYIQAPLTVCLVMGVLVRRTPAWSAWLSVLIGMSTTLLLFNVVPLPSVQERLIPIFGETFVNYLQTNKFTFTNLITVPLTTLIFFLSRYAYKRADHPAEKARYDADLDEFSRRIDTPVDFEAEVGNDSSAHQARLIGGMCMAYGCSMALATLIPNTPMERTVIFLCGAAMFSLGWVLHRRGRAKDQAA
jgi:SSS family solute:Na+ symporter